MSRGEDGGVMREAKLAPVAARYDMQPDELADELQRAAHRAFVNALDDVDALLLMLASALKRAAGLATADALGATSEQVLAGALEGASSYALETFADALEGSGSDALEAFAGVLKRAAEGEVW